MITSYSNYYQPQQQQQYVNPYAVRPQYMELGLKGRPVTSIEEVKASSIDFDGSIFYFPDITNKKIYTKQINMDGTSSLNVYSLMEQPQENNNNMLPVNAVSKEEFETVIAALTKEIEELKNQKQVINSKTTNTEQNFKF